MVFSKYLSIRIIKILLLFTLILSSGITGALAPTLHISRSVSPDTIFYSGAPYFPNKATVTLTFTAEGDTIVTGGQADVLFALDLSGSMAYRKNPVSPTKLDFAKQAALKLIDSLRQDSDRIAILGWASYNHDYRLPGITLADTSDTNLYRQDWFPISQDLLGATAFLNNIQLDWANFQLTPLNASIVVGLKYLIANLKNQGFFIILTDGINTDSVHPDTVSLSSFILS